MRLMLPPKGLGSHCLRCGEEFASPDEERCEHCGANRAAELRIHAELEPELVFLKRLLWGLAALKFTIGLVAWAHLAGPGQQQQYATLVLPQLAAGLTLALLAMLARRAPLPVTVAVAGFFALDFALTILNDPGRVLSPPWLCVATVIGVSIFGALRAAWRARRIRADASPRLPSARVRR